MARRGYRRYWGKGRSKFIGPLLPGGYAKGNAKALARRWRRRRYRYGRKKYYRKYKYGLRGGYYRMTSGSNWVKRLDQKQYAMGGTVTFRINFNAHHMVEANNAYIAGNFNPHPIYPTASFAGGIYSVTTDGQSDIDDRSMDHAGLMGDSHDKYAWFQPVWMKTVCKIKTSRMTNTAGFWYATLMKRRYNEAKLQGVEDNMEIEANQKYKFQASRMFTAGEGCTLTAFTRINARDMPMQLQNSGATSVSNYIQRTTRFLSTDTLTTIAGAYNFPVHQLVINSSLNGFGTVNNQLASQVMIWTYHTLHCRVWKGVNRNEVFN